MFTKPTFLFQKKFFKESSLTSRFSEDKVLADVGSSTSLPHLVHGSLLHGPSCCLFPSLPWARAGELPVFITTVLLDRRRISFRLSGARTARMSSCGTIGWPEESGLWLGLCRCFVNVSTSYMARNPTRGRSVPSVEGHQIRRTRVGLRGGVSGHLAAGDFACICQST